MQLTIITAHSKEQYSIAWIEINTPAGNFVIQLGHAPTIMTLSPHKPITYCLQDGTERCYLIKRGVIEIQRTTITLLVAE